jgi:glycerophosphoryl diester phosphodiesterase
LGLSRETSPLPRPLVIAHRGARTEAPENTAAAFDAALKHAADGIELDVQMTADGVPVVFHDATLHRVAGSRRRLGSCTLSELRAFDFGKWFHARFAGEPILTLDEVLSRYAGAVDLYVEVKSYWRDGQTGRTAHLTRTILSQVSAQQSRLRKRRFYLLSFDPRVLALARELVPAVAGMRNLDRPRTTPVAAAALARGIADDVPAVNLASRLLTPALARAVRARGKQLFTYTCNTPRQLAAARAVGVDGIMTDRPDWLVKAVAQPQ